MEFRRRLAAGSALGALAVGLMVVPGGPAALGAPSAAAPGAAPRVTHRALDTGIAPEGGRPATPRGPGGRWPQRSVVINLPAYTLYLYEGDRLLRSFPVAVGRYQTRIERAWVPTETPTGTFTVTAKVRRPTWYPPDWFRRARGWPKGYKVGPGVANPLGSRWLSIHRPGYQGYGIHGTNDPNSIGHAVSLGCVRMQNRDVEALFNLVEVGTRVEILYEPVRLYTDGEGRHHLTVAPDLYRRGGDLLALARARLWAAGRGEADLARVREVLAQAPAPRDLLLAGAIAGSDVATEPAFPRDGTQAAIHWPGARPATGARWRGENLLVPFSSVPEPYRRYFRPEGAGELYLYGRPLPGVVAEGDDILFPLAAAAPRFGLTWRWDGVAATARLSF